MKILTATILFFFALQTFAQDISYTQSFDSPLNLNPALTGYFPCKYRAGGNYKNRFPAYDNLYKTRTLWFDSKIKIDALRKQWFGAGFRFNNDVAGGSLRNTSGMATFAFNHGLTAGNSLYYTVGFGIGYQAHRLNYEGLVFDSQWDGNDFDPFLPANEYTLTSSNGFFDMSAGIMATYESQKANKVFIGMAMHHINKADESFSGVESPMAQMLVGHFGFDITGNNDIRFSPRVAALIKSRQIDINAGLEVGFNSSYGTFIIGAYTRNFKEFAPALGVEFRKWTFKASYDFATGTLNNHAVGMASGLEFSLVKTFVCDKRIAPSSARNKKIVPKVWDKSSVKCPSFS